MEEEEDEEMEYYDDEYINIFDFFPYFKIIK